jgi:D-glycerate 3-kinase
MSWQNIIKTSIDQNLWDQLESKLNSCVEPSINQEGLINRFYLPLFLHLHNQVSKADHSPYIIGINAPQGGGKSTLTSYLVQLFEDCELSAVTLSIDDFYHIRDRQIQIANENPENIYLQQRGYPGTHDIELGIEILSSLKNPNSIESISLPRYDKSKHQGQGDRANKEQRKKTTYIKRGTIPAFLKMASPRGFETLLPH